MTEASDCPKGYRFPKVVISYAVYLYHRFMLSYRDVQELMFQRGIEVSHETIRAWCLRFGPDIAEHIKRRRPSRSRTWHLDEMRIKVAGKIHWLWRAIDEHSEVLDILLQPKRDRQAAKRFFKRLLDDHDSPETIITDGLRSYGAALREVPELTNTAHITVSAKEHQNNLIEQSHRPTRNQERQQQGFRDKDRSQRFLFTHAHLSNLFARTRTQVPAFVRRENLKHAFKSWGELSLQLT